MKRFHVHVAVRNLQESIRFYSTMFGTAPTVAKPDYAKWMLDDPRVNFAISERNQAIGIAAGLAGALALSRWMATLLFEVKADDPLTINVLAALLAGVA